MSPRFILALMLRVLSGPSRGEEAAAGELDAPPALRGIAENVAAAPVIQDAGHERAPSG